jgi:hypothetical protein
MRLGAQTLQIVYEASPLVLGILVMHANVNCLFGTYFLTVSAEHDPEFVALLDERV